MRAALFFVLTFAFCLLPFAFSKRLPNLAALLLRANHRVADLALVGFGELRHVRERAVDAEARDRVRVGLRLKASRFGRVLLGPDLRPSKEETLLRREAVNVGRARLAFQRLLEGVVGDRQPAEVCG